MKLAAAVLVSAALMTAPASAQVVDLSTIKCKEFFESGNKDAIFAVIMWLDGYYSEDDDPPIVNFDKMKTKAEKLGTYCGNNPTHGLITAAEEVLSK
jgi:acid stress chaperone HdeB